MLRAILFSYYYTLKQKIKGICRFANSMVNNKTQKRKGTVGFAKTQTRPGSNVFEVNTSLSRLKAKPNTWEEVGRPILAVGLIGEITPSQNNQRYSLLLAEQ